MPWYGGSVLPHLSWRQWHARFLWVTQNAIIVNESVQDSPGLRPNPLFIERVSVTLDHTRFHWPQGKYCLNGLLTDILIYL